LKFVSRSIGANHKQHIVSCHNFAGKAPAVDLLTEAKRSEVPKPRFKPPKRYTIRASLGTKPAVKEHFEWKAHFAFGKYTELVL